MKLPELVIITAGLCAVSASEANKSNADIRAMFSKPDGRQAEKSIPPKTNGVRKHPQVKTESYDEIKRRELEEKTLKDNEAAGDVDDEERSGVVAEKSLGVKEAREQLKDKIVHPGRNRSGIALPGIGSRTTLKPVNSVPAPVVSTTSVIRPRGPAARRAPSRPATNTATTSASKGEDANEGQPAPSGTEAAPESADQPEAPAEIEESEEESAAPKIQSKSHLKSDELAKVLKKFVLSDINKITEECATDGKSKLHRDASPETESLLESANSQKTLDEFLEAAAPHVANASAVATSKRRRSVRVFQTAVDFQKTCSVIALLMIIYLLFDV